MKLEKLTCLSDIKLDDYIAFRDIVKENMEYPDWLGDFSEESLAKMFSEGMRIWVYYYKEDPVCSMMLIPATKKDLEKFELDYDYRDVVDYGPMFVNPKYVGNRLQRQMLLALDKISKELGYRYAVSTVHPDNFYSSNNLEAVGFSKVFTKEFKRGIRNVYVKEILL